MMIGVIVQARMGSKRLPGKILADIEGKPMIQYQIERIKKCSLADEIIVATSNEKSDDPVEALCSKLKVKCYRGSLNNVASRFKEIIDAYSLGAFVRISGDSPLIDPGVIDKAIRIFKEGEYDIVTNVLKRTFPKGQSVEVFRACTFGDIYGEISDPDDLEHVTRYFYRQKDKFRIFNFTLDEDYSGLNLSVDTKQDFENISSVIRMMNKESSLCAMEKVIEMYKGSLAGKSNNAKA